MAAAANNALLINFCSHIFHWHIMAQNSIMAARSQMTLARLPIDFSVFKCPHCSRGGSAVERKIEFLHHHKFRFLLALLRHFFLVFDGESFTLPLWIVKKFPSRSIVSGVCCCVCEAEKERETFSRLYKN
jgi:hypothetical protein